MRPMIPTAPGRAGCAVTAALSLLAGDAAAQLTWTAASGAAAPTPRSAARAASVPFNQLALLFGGEDAGGVLGDTWGFNGVSWTQLASSPSPPPRSHHVMAPFDYHVILFGGRDANGTALGDAWIWVANQQVWTLLQGGPPARYGAAIASFGPERSVLFGGRAGAQTLGDTWICNPYGSQIWSTPPLGVSPPARHGHAMARFGGDLLGQSPARLVLFGGVDATGTHLDDTWVFGYSAGVPQWTPATPSVRPPARRGHAMGYAMERGRAQMFGGEGPNGLLQDTWEWNGAEWIAMTTIGTPAPRADGALVDARHGPGYAPLDRMLIGGRDGSGPITQPWWLTTSFPAASALFGAVTSQLVVTVQGPWLGGSLQARMYNGSQALVAPHLIAGFSNTTSVLGPLPLGLGAAFSNATLLVDPVILFPLTALAPNGYGIDIALPSVPAAAGTHVYLQAIAYLPSLGAWGISRGTDCTLGWL
jgi:hypothetical protein